MHRAAMDERRPRPAPADACRVPRKSGSSEGWMLIIRPGPALDERVGENPHETCEADQVDVAARRAPLERRVEARAIGIGRVVDGERLDPGLARRASSPPASGRLERTSAISPGKIRLRARPRSATGMFEPRPEIRMAMRRRVMTSRGVREVSTGSPLSCAMVSPMRTGFSPASRRLAIDRVGPIGARRPRSCRCRN